MVDLRGVASSLVGQNIGECLQRWVECVDAGENRFCQFACRDPALRQGSRRFTKVCDTATAERNAPPRSVALSHHSPSNTTSGLDVACSNKCVPARSDRSSELRLAMANTRRTSSKGSLRPWIIRMNGSSGANPRDSNSLPTARCLSSRSMQTEPKSALMSWQVGPAASFDRLRQEGLFASMHVPRARK